ncbi:spermatogenesis-associated protein 45 isoform X1 [Podarcis raffonei]|uniref:spermatogenesis-associated protein 45 isoform X1 n=2 Tax=Podarcis raffonei TaxID=65483 RepID=UPI0023295F9B|nr:spermatogenesis-associated protein 45 isoform X1 [Podarcis raffonei]
MGRTSSRDKEKFQLTNMAKDEKKLLIEYNKMRDPGCWLEGKSETAWLRPQRRHYPFSNRNSAEIFKIVKHEYISDRASWITIGPPENKEKRHFPEKSHAIFG